MSSPKPRRKALFDRAAWQLAENFRRGELSAREIVQAHIDRINAVNPRLNALVLPRFEDALQEAEQADRDRQLQRRLGPLAGVPITVKEQLIVAGMDVTLGLRSRVGQPFAYDGPMIQRLRQAGAIILGKTNVMELLIGYESDNSVYGRTLNPHRLDRTPGGSSGGEAALLAAGGTPLGIGCDLGGSIRIPAAFCGIYGFKPSSRRFTNVDTPFEPFGAMAGQEAIVAQIGPMARSARDLRLVMRVLASPGPLLSVDYIPPVAWAGSERSDVSGLRVGVFTDNGLFTPSPAVRRAVEAVRRSLDDLGAEVVDFTPPSAVEATRILLGILSADGGATLRQALGKQRPHPLLRASALVGAIPRPLLTAAGQALERLGQKGAGMVLQSMGVRSTAQYWQLALDAARYRTAFVESMNAAGVDAILCPAFGTVAPRHGTSTDLFLAASYAYTFNVASMPAGVVPVTRVRPGEESDRRSSFDLTERAASKTEIGSCGLPVGVQLSAPPWKEETVLRLMSALEPVLRDQSEYPELEDLLV